MAEFEKESEEEWLKNIDLCHPEVLSCAQLSRVLELRNIPVEDCKSDKDKILALFRRTVLPLPQRDYRPNRRGQLLMSKRVKLQRKRKTEESYPSTSSSLIEKQVEPASKCIKLTSISPAKRPDATSRLKPPPNPVSAEKKIIKLNSKACNGSVSVSVRSENSGVSKGNKMIKLINDTLMSNAKVPNSNGSAEKNCKTPEKSTADETTPPKKKHKPIMWP